MGAFRTAPSRYAFNLILHIETILNINTKAKNRLNVICSFTHTTYGNSNEDITTIYKQYIRPILTYAHTAWQPDDGKTHINKLQTTQNTALPIATVCTKSTPLPHLHEETQVLPLTSHMDMRGTHIYTSTAPPTLHAKPNTNTEKHTSDTRTTLPHAAQHSSSSPGR